MQAKKVSYHQETATDTAGHNDRSMYKTASERALNSPPNSHFDMYNCGSSVKAEKLFYEETFRARLDKQNARAKEMRKYERIMTMDEYHQKHMPKESIIQLGEVGNNEDTEEFCRLAFALQKKKIEEAGGIVISSDLHLDEETPHLHTRYIFVCNDKKDNLPKVDMKNTLLAHGVGVPDPTKKIGKHNHPANTFVSSMREALEDLADEYETKRGRPKVDRERKKGSHSTVEVYKLTKQVEELTKQLASYLAQLERLEGEKEKKQSELKDLDDAYLTAYDENKQFIEKQVAEYQAQEREAERRANEAKGNSAFYEYAEAFLSDPKKREARIYHLIKSSSEIRESFEAVKRGKLDKLDIVNIAKGVAELFPELQRQREQAQEKARTAQKQAQESHRKEMPKDVWKEPQSATESDLSL